ncbi:MAG: hypothetical protein O2800_03895 [Planctomycetota bacterium]|nr:hypothetical protein [Planctomycetota bacterium]
MIRLSNHSGITWAAALVGLLFLASCDDGSSTATNGSPDSVDGSPLGSGAQATSLLKQMSQREPLAISAAEVIRILVPAARAGNDDAALAAAHILLHGEGVPVDRSLGQTMLEIAATRGSGEAAYRLSASIAELSPEGWKDAASRQWESRAAELNHPAALRTLANHTFEETDPKTQSDAAIALLVRAADAGDSIAQFQLAARLLRGDGIAHDAPRAISLLELASREDVLEAQILLAVTLDEGVFTDRDPTSAVGWYLLAGAAGNPMAQLRVAQMYRDGDGLTPDAVQAAEWFAKAAAQGAPRAEAALGALYSTGTGVQRDGAVAEKYLRSAAEKGDRESQLMLGRLYQTGDVFAANMRDSAYWFSQAVRDGDQDAQYELARMFVHGSGVERDPVEAARLFGLSSAQGNPEACFAMGTMHEFGEVLPRSDAEALKMYEIACADEIPDAHYGIARVILRSARSTAMEREAAPHLLFAAERGLDGAQLDLGRMCRDGRGVGYDRVAAYAWMNLAAGIGNGQAARERDVLAPLMSQSEIGAAQQVSLTLLKVTPDEAQANRLRFRPPGQNRAGGDKQLTAPYGRGSSRSRNHSK